MKAEWYVVYPRDFPLNAKILRPLRATRVWRRLATQHPFALKMPVNLVFSPYICLASSWTILRLLFPYSANTHVCHITCFSWAIISVVDWKTCIPKIVILFSAIYLVAVTSLIVIANPASWTKLSTTSLFHLLWGIFSRNPSKWRILLILPWKN